MRTAALFAIAVLFASAVRAAAPKPEDWYTPETYADEGNTGSLYFNGNTPVTVSLDANGNILGGKEIEKEIGKDFRLKTALGAIQMALKNTKQIQTMGKNLNDLLILGGISIADNAGGGSYTVRFGDGTKSIKDVIAAKDNKGNVPATSDRKLADGLTLDWRVDNVNGKEVRSLQLKGARDAVSVDNYKSQWFRLGGDAYYLPFLRWGSAAPGVGELIWTNFGGFDNTAFGEVPTAKQGTHGVPLTLRGWYTNDFEHTTVTRLMTEDDDDAKDLRKKLQILARKTISDQSSAPDHLTYIPIGDVISGLGLPPDGVSIEDHVEGNTTNLAIKGWHAGTATPNVVLADLMTSEKSEGAQSGPTYHVLLRKLGEGAETNSIAYATLGDLHKMSWSTNWYNAVKDIAEDRATAIVNWNTNWVYLAGEIAKSKEATERYVDNALNWSTNWFASTTAMNASQAEIKNYIDGQLDIITNALNAIESAKASVTSINNVKQYIDSVMDYQTNVIIATERAKTSGAIESTQKLVNDTFDILTNELAAIDKVVKDTGIETINTVKDYVDTKFDFETNVIVSVELAKQNHSIEDVRTFVNDTFELITNRLNGIDNLIKSGEVASIHDVASYIDAQLDIETNIVKATELAQANQSIADIKAFVDDTYTILTNTLAAIENLKKSGEVGISSVKDYVDTKLNIDTNLVSVLKIAEMNKSIESIRDFVRDSLEAGTNLVASINDFVEGQHIDGVRTISDYMRWKMNYETNLLEKIAQANKKMGELDAREFATFVTNLYQNTYEVENWEIITNVYITYFGGKMAKAGERVEPPKLDPKDDPYSPEFEEDEYSDFLLPVKNARIINEATNAPLNKIRAEHMFDFDVLDTNVVTVGSGEDAHTFPVVQLRGFSLADAETCTKVPVKRSKDKIKPPESTGEAPYSTEFASDYALDWMDFPEALIGITSNGIEKIEKWLKEQNEVNIFNLVASNHVKIAKLKTDPYETIEAGYLLDHKTLWTNDTRKAEIMGYHAAEPYTVPYIDYGEVTNLVDMGELVDNGWYEPVIDPETGEQAIDPETGDPMEEWIENWEWEENWQEVVTTEKFFKWEKFPMSDERLQEKYLSQYRMPWFWSLSGGEVETTIHGVGQHVWNYSSIFGFPTADDCAIPWRHEVDDGDDEDTKSNCIARVNWTEKPEDASSTKNYELTMNGTRVAWTPSASAIRFVGNVGSDGSVNEAVVGEGANTNTVTFASAADSNVKVDVQGDGNGNVTITIGVYYLNNAGVQPPYAE